MVRVTAATSELKPKPIRRRRRSVIARTARRARVPRLGPCIRGIVQDVRTAGELSQDHSGERQSAAANLLPALRSPIYSTTPGEGQQASYMVRVGILRQSRDFVPRRQNWFRSALPWVSSVATLHRNEKQA